MKTIFLLFFTLQSFLMQAQLTLVEYDVTKNTYDQTITKEILFFDEKTSYTMIWDVDGVTSLDGIFKQYNFKKDFGYFRNLNNINQFYDLSTGLTTIEKFLYLDEKPTIQWKLSKEQKSILGYTCQKAIGDFRGRTWEVWFTKDIQSNLGPWKLDGLPGLILEAKEKTGFISYTAKQIIKNTNYKVPLEMIAFVEKKYPSHYKLYKESVIELDHHIQSIRDEAIANRPKGTLEVGVYDPRTWSIEYSYEWETSKTQK